MGKTLAIFAALALSQAAYAEENAWDKFLREDREKTSQAKAERTARVEQADRAVMDSAKGLRNPTLVLPAPTAPAQATEPGQPQRTKSYLANTPNGFKQCRAIGDVVTCS